MYHDIEPGNWANLSHNTPLNTILFGEPSKDEGDPSPVATYDLDDDETIKSVPIQLYDCDSSQMEAVLDAAKGRNLVIQGPPGTGKSQTITNIIASCLSQGKSVLFVAEKQAALSVVKKRLDLKGCGPFCLELHSNKTNKVLILESLKERLELLHNVRRTNQFEITQQVLLERKASLIEYAKTLNQKIPMLDRPLLDVIWKHITLKNLLGESAASLSDVHIDNIDTWTPSHTMTVRGITSALRTMLEEINKRYGELTNDPWLGLVRAEDASTQADTIVARTNLLLKHLEGLSEVVERLESENDAEWIRSSSIGSLLALTSIVGQTTELSQSSMAILQRMADFSLIL